MGIAPFTVGKTLTRSFPALDAPLILFLLSNIYVSRMICYCLPLGESRQNLSVYRSTKSSYSIVLHGYAFETQLSLGLRLCIHRTSFILAAGFNIIDILGETNTLLKLLHFYDNCAL
jgi:hypothetical protein